MPCEIFADGSVKKALEEAFSIFGSIISANVRVVYAETAEGFRSRSNYAGLETVLELAESSDEPVLLVSMSTLSMMADIIPFQAALGYPHVAYLNALQLGNFPNALREAYLKSRPKDDLAIALAKLEIKQDAVRILQHDLRNFRASGRGVDERWLILARNTFGENDPGELEILVDNCDSELSVDVFNGRVIRGAFFDVEGTLVKDNLVDPDVASLLRQSSKQLPVTIWTDGDIKAASAILREVGFYQKILPKQLFTGAIISGDSLVFDDMELADFVDQHEISCADPACFHHIV